MQLFIFSFVKLQTAFWYTYFGSSSDLSLMRIAKEVSLSSETIQVPLPVYLYSILLLCACFLFIHTVYTRMCSCKSVSIDTHADTHRHRHTPPLAVHLSACASPAQQYVRASTEAAFSGWRLRVSALVTRGSGGVYLLCG